MALTFVMSTKNTNINVVYLHKPKTNLICMELDQFDIVLKQHSKTIRQAMDVIVNEGVSNYPIIMVCPESLDLDIGIILLHDKPTKWLFKATTLEELVMKKVVDISKKDEFTQLYKSKSGYICLFMVNQDESGFIFHPG